MGELLARKIFEKGYDFDFRAKRSSRLSFMSVHCVLQSLSYNRGKS